MMIQWFCRGCAIC